MLGGAGQGPDWGNRGQRGPAGAAQEDDARADHRGIQARGAGRKCTSGPPCASTVPGLKRHPGRRGDRARAGSQAGPRRPGQARRQRSGVRDAARQVHRGGPAAHRVRGDAGLAGPAGRAHRRDGGRASGTKIADGKSSAPTRPHPHTPPTPGARLGKTAGPAAAATWTRSATRSPAEAPTNTPREQAACRPRRGRGRQVLTGGVGPGTGFPGGGKRSSRMIRPAPSSQAHGKPCRRASRSTASAGLACRRARCGQASGLPRSRASSGVESQAGSPCVQVSRSGTCKAALRPGRRRPRWRLAPAAAMARQIQTAVSVPPGVLAPTAVDTYSRTGGVYQERGDLQAGAARGTRRLAESARSAAKSR